MPTSPTTHWATLIHWDYIYLDVTILTVMIGAAIMSLLGPGAPHIRAFCECVGKRGSGYTTERHQRSGLDFERPLWEEELIQQARGLHVNPSSHPFQTKE
jgi:hypothetical protein